MAQIINTNVMSLNAQRNLNNTATGLSTALQRLSSGLRVNSSMDDAAAHFRAGMAHQKAKRFTESVGLLRRALVLDKTLPRASHALGMSLLQLGEVEEAAKALDDAVDREPDDGALRAALAFALQKLERWEKAEQEYGHAIQRGVTDAHVLANRARVLEKLGRTEAMARAYLDLAKLDPDRVEPWKKAAGAFLALEQWERAEDAYQHAVVLAPNDAALRFELGVCHVRRGNKEGAKKQLALLQGMDPGAAERLRTLLGG